MLPSHRPPRYLLSVGLLLSQLGCSLSGQGDLKVDWSIEEQTTDTVCSDYDVDTVKVTVLDRYERTYMSSEADCSEFSTTLDSLAEGTYQVSLQVFDANANELSSQLGPKDVRIWDGKTSTVRFAIDRGDISNDLSPESGTGQLQVEWSIGGEAESAYCSGYGVDRVEIHLFDAAGDESGEGLVVACGDFETTVESLHSGSYSVTAQLLDQAGEPLTDVKGPTIVKVEADATRVVLFDFSLTDFWE